MRSSMRRLAAFLLIFGLGCSSAEPEFAVSGTITHGNKPIKDGTITFLSSVGKKDSFSAAIVDGKYTTNPIPVGPTRVMIVARQTPGNITGGNEGAIRRGAKGPEVPGKYADPDKSGLTYDVKAGENTYDQDLK